MSRSTTNSITVASPVTATPMDMSGAGSESPFGLLNDRLRGRWRYAVALGLVLGTLFAVSGYLMAPVRYTSMGSIHVAPAGTPILIETADTNVVPRYDSLIRTQALYVRTARVIDRALQNEKLTAVPLARTPDARERVLRDLRADIQRNSELIHVSFEADAPATAQAVVNSILEAYEEIHGQRGGEFRTLRQQRLKGERDDYRARRNVKQREIEDFIATSSSGARDVQQILQIKLLRMEEIRQEVDRLDLMLESLKDGGKGLAAVPADTEPTAGQLRMLDPELALLHSRRDEARIRLDQLEGRLNPRHLAVREARRELESIDERIATQEQAARRLWEETGGVLPSESGRGLLADMDPHKRREALVELLTQYQAEVRKLNDEQSRIAELSRELDEIESNLAELDERLRIQDIESDAQFSGAITVTEMGVAPMTASTDRRLALAAVGFVAGNGFSFALFVLIGTLDRRMYSASQLRHADVRLPCLGVLPDLDAGQADPERSQSAADCVHQIRNRIEVLRDAAPSVMLVVTSPFQGDGKTSLTMALGCSYAMAGHRTLLLDCDLVGASLSRQMDVLGCPGLREVLRDRHLDGHVRALSMPNLYMLGTGLDPSFGPESIRKDDFFALCEELRQQYDIIIADTGPFIGSVELLPVAAAANGVVLSIRRGRSQTRLGDCVDDLETIGVPCLGVVLNCADQSDCERYMSKSAVSARRVDVAAAAGRTEGQRFADNALVQAVRSGRSQD